VVVTVPPWAAGARAPILTQIRPGVTVGAAG
jgi:hypothetical protein